MSANGKSQVFFEEALLNDKRFTENLHVHHKYLSFSHELKRNLEFTYAIEHIAFWGGESETYGKQPGGFGNYLRILFSIPGGKDALETDQENVLGNHLGQYKFLLKKSSELYRWEMYLCHPFEDFSGMYMANYTDNLYGAFFQFRKEQLLESILLEYCYTMLQGGPPTEVLPSGREVHVNGGDNYYNHGYYSSGWTFHGMNIGSALLGPVLMKDGISAGISNNRMAAWHLGAMGHLHSSVSWKSLFTYSQNYGTYHNRFDPDRKQLSLLMEFNYKHPKEKFELAVSGALDKGSLWDNGENKVVTGMNLLIRRNF